MVKFGRIFTRLAQDASRATSLSNFRSLLQILDALELVNEIVVRIY